MTAFAASADRAGNREEAPRTSVTGIDAGGFRDALATGIALVTPVCAEGRPAGMTRSSFDSVSLALALALFGIDRRARSIRALRRAGADYPVSSGWPLRIHY